MVLLNGRPTRVTLEEALDVLHIFDDPIPCWLADAVVTMIATALIDQLMTTGTIGTTRKHSLESGPVGQLKNAARIPSAKDELIRGIQRADA
jgi:hypothetical protein